MSDEYPAFKPHPALPDYEKRRLVAEALAPLTPAEMEQWRQNRVNDTMGASLKSKLRVMAAALGCWQHASIVAQVKKGALPEWIFDPARVDEVVALLKAGGYHFQGGGFSWEFRRGEEVLSTFELRLNGKRA